ncbi:hypothetical protein [Sphingomonas crocodyli]|uniref:Uncharacterized protein n=1 Tax=Sphingomonas crocodyli TaxID=1979270 RepID=A0A437M7N5_9SPHN|nr:hypothetical protein [Sphingomonas crocodyli]RVT93730.1 hypothetical protein EOD43_07645 [Sphingomonas crocodyli]
MTRYATIWRADSPLARCARCGTQQQFHGQPGRGCDAFRAETAFDVDPADLTTRDLIRHHADTTGERRAACRAEISDRIKNEFGLSFDDLALEMGEVA